MNTRTCTKCNCCLPLEDFPPDNRGKSDGKQSRCRRCINDFVKEHYHKYPVKHMLRRAAGRAKKKGFEFSITAEDISPLPTICPVLQIPLRKSIVRHDPNAYSLDRIDNNLGYVKGNVCVMSYLANRLKNNGTADQHQSIADWMRKMLPTIPKE